MTVKGKGKICAFNFFFLILEYCKNTNVVQRVLFGMLAFIRKKKDLYIIFFFYLQANKPSFT